MLKSFKKAISITLTAMFIFGLLPSISPLVYAGGAVMPTTAWTSPCQASPLTTEGYYSGAKPSSAIDGIVTYTSRWRYLSASTIGTKYVSYDLGSIKSFGEVSFYSHMPTGQSVTCSLQVSNTITTLATETPLNLTLSTDEADNISSGGVILQKFVSQTFPDISTRYVRLAFTFPGCVSADTQNVVEIYLGTEVLLKSKVLMGTNATDGTQYREMPINPYDTLQLGKSLIPIKYDGVLATDNTLCDATTASSDTSAIFTPTGSTSSNTIDFDFSNPAFNEHRTLKDITVYTVKSSSSIGLQYSTMENPTVFTSVASSVIPLTATNSNFQKIWNFDGQLTDINTLRILSNNASTDLIKVGEIDINLETEPQSIVDTRDNLLKDITLHEFFCDNVILQQKRPIKVWGFGGGKDGNTVSVSIAGQTKIATVQNKKWMATLDPLTAGLDYSMTVTGVSNSITVSNVAVGEVFIAAGQSNMQRYINTMGDFAAAEIPTEENTYVRNFKHDAGSSMGTRNQERDNLSNGVWQIAGPTTVPNFTAVGYIFARELQKKLNVPVGIIFGAIGGSSIKTWMGYEDLVGTGDSAFASEEAKTLSLYNGSVNTAKANTVSYYGLIKPMQPYAVRGVLWYQGEADDGAATLYKKEYSKMVNTWRAGFNNPTMPFLNVQLAPFDRADSDYVAMRDTQIYNMYANQNVATVVITDTVTEPGATDIHPSNKRPVGERLALAAMGLIYGQDTEFLSPLYKSMTVSNAKATLTFQHVGDGLKLKNGDPNLIGFEISADGTNFVSASAAIIGTDKIQVWNSSVLSPTTVRFGWQKVPIGNLFNSINLPASPFHTSTIPSNVIKDINPSTIIDGIHISTWRNTKINLPTTVKKVNLDGTSTDVSVNWDQSAVDFTSSEIGKFIVYGTAQTSDTNFYRAIANITVIGSNLPFALSNLAYTSNQGTGNISVELKNNTTDEKTANIIYAVYNGNKLVGVKISPQSVGASETKSLYYPVPIFLGATWDTIKVFVFDTSIASIKSLSESAVFEKQMQ